MCILPAHGPVHIWWNIRYLRISQYIYIIKHIFLQSNINWMTSLITNIMLPDEDPQSSRLILKEKGKKQVYGWTDPGPGGLITDIQGGQCDGLTKVLKHIVSSLGVTVRVELCCSCDVSLTWGSEMVAQHYLYQLGCCAWNKAWKMLLDLFLWVFFFKISKLCDQKASFFFYIFYF